MEVPFNISSSPAPVDQLVVRSKISLSLSVVALKAQGAKEPFVAKTIVLFALNPPVKVPKYLPGEPSLVQTIVPIVFSKTIVADGLDAPV